MRHLTKTLALALLVSGLCTTLFASEAGKSKSIEISKDSQKIHAKQDGTLKKNGVTSLQDYVIEEKEMYDFLFKNHPITSKYKPKGKVVGKLVVKDRGYEFAHEGHGDDFQKFTDRTGPTSMMYRLARQSTLKYPNKFIGPKKCGECHASQYEKWNRSRHSSTIRFPGEHPEVGNNLTSSVFGKDTASILPQGITPDVVYATVGHLRTKLGFIDGWMLRGTYHVEGGLLKDGTGTIIAGGNQFQRTWANDLTPEVAEKIRKYVPNFPVTLKEHGDNSGYIRGLASYAARYKKSMSFQAGSSYCEVCHPWKFDFKTKEEYYKALGNAKELQKHTVSKGISCEECHGAGGHLEGGSGMFFSNCERCHQRFSFRPFLAEKYQKSKDPRTKSRAAELGITSKFKSSGPGCGTEGSQSYFTAHYEAGMRCATCHDPHDTSGYVKTTTAKEGGVYTDTGDYLSSFYSKPAIKKDCASCHKTQASVVKNTKDTHSKLRCESCHMPYTMSCENFYAIQYVDHAGFDTQRRSHVWKIDVHPTRKTLNPPPGAPREQSVPKKYKDWYMAKNDQGHNFIDLMWACGKTSWADKDIEDNKGCHSIVQSELKKTLHFKDQQRVYEEVMGWQEPIKKIYSEVTVSIKGLYELLETTKLSVSDRSRVNELIEKAQGAMDMIKKDGSWGVHGFKYTKRRADAAASYVAEARNIIKKASH